MGWELSTKNGTLQTREIAVMSCLHYNRVLRQGSAGQRTNVWSKTQKSSGVRGSNKALNSELACVSRWRPFSTAKPISRLATIRSSGRPAALSVHALLGSDEKMSVAITGDHRLISTILLCMSTHAGHTPCDLEPLRSTVHTDYFISPTGIYCWIMTCHDSFDLPLVRYRTVF